MMTNSFKKQRKQSPLAAAALLSVLLGAQTAVFAGINIAAGGGTPYSYKLGFNVGANGVYNGLSPADIATNLGNACHSAFGSGTGNQDFNECIYGGQVGIHTALFDS